MKLLVLSVVLAASSLSVTVEGLRCRFCRKAIYLEDCNDVEDCADNEICFMEEKIDPAGLFPYHVGGCRSKTLCSSVKRKRNSAYITCSTCCNSKDFCNDQLCDLRQGANTTHCLACGGLSVHGGVPAVNHPEDCRKLDVCQADQMCFSEMYGQSNGFKYVTKCLSTRVCRTLMGIFLKQNFTVSPDKRDFNVCSVCCGDNYCNREACLSVRDRMQNLYNTGRLDMMTLKEKPKPKAV